MRHSGLFVTGIGTGVGKTVAAGAVAHLLRGKGYSVGVMKPVQTGTAKKNKRRSDIEFLRKMAGTKDPDELSVPYSFKAPFSPYHAAEKEKRKIKPSAIAGAFESLLEKHDFVIVESAGGLMVPVTEDAFWPDIVKRLGLPVLIVTHPELGMIHQTLSTVMAAEMYGLDVAGIFIVEKSKKKNPPLNIKWLEKHTGLPLLGFLPYTNALKKGNAGIARFRAHVKKNIDAGPIVDFLERKESAKTQKRLEKADKKHLWHPFTQMREWEGESLLIADSASGITVTDNLGGKYYDGHSSYWVNLHGHGNPALIRTLTRQAAKLDHATFLGLSNKPAIELAEKLVEIAPESLTKVFYSDNGSTAVEVGLKMAIQYHRQTNPPKPAKTKFVALENAYHGDTLGAVGVGGIGMYREIFKSVLPETIFVQSPYCYRCPIGKSYPSCSFACADEMEKTVAARHAEIAAFVIEPMVQCPGGIITFPHGYLKRVREVCDRYDILMIADEVAVGFGRTGKMFACEHEEVQPDIMAVAKSLAAGVLPLAATMTNQKVFDAFLGTYDERRTFFHGHTFTGHPPACAVALESLRIFKNKKILQSLEDKSLFLGDELVRFENLPHVGDIRQLGMIVGIELVKDRDTKEPFEPSLRTGHKVIMEARKRGLIVRPLGDVIVFFPILSSKTGDLKKMADILYESISSL